MDEHCDTCSEAATWRYESPTGLGTIIRCQDHMWYTPHEGWDVMTDGVWVQYGRSDGSDDDLHERIEDSVNAILCAQYGHEIEDDHCGLPHHRYCIWCRKRVTELV